MEQLTLDRRNRARDPRIVARQEADEREEQQARVEVFRAVGLHERSELLVEAVLADLVVNTLAQSTPDFLRAVETVLFDGANSPVECDPRHHLRVHEVSPLSADLPDSVVRQRPVFLESPEERLLQLPGMRLFRKTVRARLVQRV